MGILKVKKYAVHDPFRLEDEGKPTAQHDKDAPTYDNNNQSSFENEVQGNPS